MPTASERAMAESGRWADLVGHWTKESAPEPWADRPPTERDVVIFHDPTLDLERRAGEWGHTMHSVDLSSIGVLAAAFGEAEAAAWDDGVLDLATRAYEARRFLLADRLIHWAVPWLDSVVRAYPNHRPDALSDMTFMLDLGDEMRVAPELVGREGLVIEGEDSFGPVSNTSSTGSLWSGLVLIAGETAEPTLFAEAAERWKDLASTHPGSAQLWLDLSERAEKCSVLLGHGPRSMGDR